MSENNSAATGALANQSRFARAGVIARWKPVHLGSLIMLEHVLERSDHLTIGIGSSNKYNARNPFTAEETEVMIRLALEPKHENFSIVYVPDFAHLREFRDGRKWAETVFGLYKELDCFVTANDYAAKLLSEHYRIIHPSELIPRENWLPLKSSMVRAEMAKNGGWQRLVPEAVADYIMGNRLDERFRREFGLETLALLFDRPEWDPDSKDQQRIYTYER